MAEDDDKCLNVVTTKSIKVTMLAPVDISPEIVDGF